MVLLEVFPPIYGADCMSDMSRAGTLCQDLGSSITSTKPQVLVIT